VSFEKLSAPIYCQRLPARTAPLTCLFKIQLIKFNLMVPVDCEPTSASRFAVPVNQRRAPDVRHLRKSRYRIVHGPDPTRRFICARRTRGRARRFGGNGRICATGWFGGNGKCADQWNCAGPGKRWRNEQCGGRSQRDRQRFQNSSAAAATHSCACDSAVQVKRKAFAEPSPAVGPKS